MCENERWGKENVGHILSEKSYSESCCEIPQIVVADMGEVEVVVLRSARMCSLETREEGEASAALGLEE